jgi:hypothetical protein
MRRYREKAVTFLIVVPPALVILTLILISCFGRLPTGIRILLRIIWVIWGVLFIGLLLVVRGRVWTYRPRSIKGTFGGLKWVAKIKYDKSRREVNAEIGWLCPEHRMPLQVRDSGTLDTSHSTLFCPKCNKSYDLKLAGDVASPEEAEIAVKQDVLSEVDFSELDKVL